MRLEKDNAAQCARMSKIRLTADEEKMYADQLQGLFNWVNQLSEVDTSRVEETSCARAAYLRPDTPVTDGELSGALVSAFNDKEGACAKVKKVL